jgi:hypothetical protein
MRRSGPVRFLLDLVNPALVPAIEARLRAPVLAERDRWAPGSAEE